jgi:hypothetical protein
MEAPHVDTSESILVGTRLRSSPGSRTSWPGRRHCSCRLIRVTQPSRSRGGVFALVGLGNRGEKPRWWRT